MFTKILHLFSGTSIEYYNDEIVKACSLHGYPLLSELQVCLSVKKLKPLVPAFLMAFMSGIIVKFIFVMGGTNLLKGNLMPVMPNIMSSLIAYPCSQRIGSSFLAL